MRHHLAAYTQRIRQMTRALHNPATVTFVGEVENISDYYKAADLFVFPSGLEGLPNAILEAMACGLPCLLVPFLGCPGDGEEFGTEGIHHLKSNDDPRELAIKLVLTIENRELRQQIGTAARNWMEETQNLERTLDHLAAVYQKRRH